MLLFLKAGFYKENDSGFFKNQLYIYISYRAASTDIPNPLLATSPYRSSPPAGLQGYIPYPHIATECMFELVVLLSARPYVGVNRSTSIMSSFLLLQQCPACLVRLTWIVFVIGGRWPYSVAARTCSILVAAFLCNCRLASFPRRLVTCPSSASGGWGIQVGILKSSKPQPRKKTLFESVSYDNHVSTFYKI